MISEKLVELVQLFAGDGEGPLPFGLVYDHVPEEPFPPCVILQPAEPFLAEDTTGDRTFAGELLISFEAVLLVDLDDNDRATSELYDKLDAFVPIVVPSDWWIAGMGQPGPMRTSEWLHHGVKITLQSRVQP